MAKIVADGLCRLEVLRECMGQPHWEIKFIRVFDRMVRRVEKLGAEVAKARDGDKV
jgi:hypothetical protein